MNADSADLRDYLPVETFSRTSLKKISDFCVNQRLIWGEKTDTPSKD
jgi:hypothetical protein